MKKSAKARKMRREASAKAVKTFLPADGIWPSESPRQRSISRASATSTESVSAAPAASQVLGTAPIQKQSEPGAPSRFSSTIPDPAIIACQVAQPSPSLTQIPQAAGRHDDLKAETGPSVLENGYDGEKPAPAQLSLETCQPAQAEPVDLTRLRAGLENLAVTVSAQGVSRPINLEESAPNILDVSHVGEIKIAIEAGRALLNDLDRADGLSSARPDLPSTQPISACDANQFVAVVPETSPGSRDDPDQSMSSDSDYGPEMQCARSRTRVFLRESPDKFAYEFGNSSADEAEVCTMSLEELSGDVDHAFVSVENLISRSDRPQPDESRTETVRANGPPTEHVMASDSLVRRKPQRRHKRTRAPPPPLPKVMPSAQPPRRGQSELDDVRAFESSAMLKQQESAWRDMHLDDEFARLNPHYDLANRTLNDRLRLLEMRYTLLEHGSVSAFYGQSGLTLKKYPSADDIKARTSKARIANARERLRDIRDHRDSCIRALCRYFGLYYLKEDTNTELVLDPYADRYARPVLESVYMTATKTDCFDLWRLYGSEADPEAVLPEVLKIEVFKGIISSLDGFYILNNKPTHASQRARYLRTAARLSEDAKISTLKAASERAKNCSASIARRARVEPTPTSN